MMLKKILEIDIRPLDLLGSVWVRWSGTNDLIQLFKNLDLKYLINPKIMGVGGLNSQLFFKVHLHTKSDEFKNKHLRAESIRFHQVTEAHASAQ